MTPKHKTHTLGGLWAHSKIRKEKGEFMRYLRGEGYNKGEIKEILEQIDRMQNHDKTVYFGRVI